jgi:ABC-2 type transport system ATP-binding protein
MNSTRALKCSPTVDEMPMNRDLAICTRNLTKQFDQHIAVNDVDLEIEMGAVYGLIGPNGAGKTTLIRMLATAEEPTTGDILINGEPLRWTQLSPSIRRYLGYLPDDFPLYEDLNVWDYLDYFGRLYQLQEPARSRRLNEVLELVQLTHKRQSAIASLSRGMKQRLSLARTIIHEPLILLLDEPVSGLDPIARIQFREIIQTLQEAGMTILISSHVLSDLAELCTSIGIMELGYLVESAPLSDLYQRLSRQHIRLTTLGAMDRLVQELRQVSTVGEMQIEAEKREVLIEFSGTVEDSAALLRSLIQAGIPLNGFHQTQEDLETIFLRLGHRQAS